MFPWDLLLESYGPRKPRLHLKLVAKLVNLRVIHLVLVLEAWQRQEWEGKVKEFMFGAL